MWGLGGQLSRAVGYIAHLAAAGLVESTRVLDLAPWLAHRLPPPPLLAVVLYLAALTTWVVARDLVSRRGSKAGAVRQLARAAGAVAAVAGFWSVSGVSWRVASGDHRLLVAFIDVGQGDATLIRFPDGRSMLVDAGGLVGSAQFDFGSRVVVPAIWARGLTRLDILALSHGDPDHIGGAPGVLRDLRPREVWEGIDVPTHRPTLELRSIAASQKSLWRPLLAGSRTQFGDVELIVWHPPRPDWERQRVRNDDSLVIEAVYKNVSLVLTGDISAEVESDLADALSPASLRILKVPHHGSRTSSSERFLHALGPAISVVSAGRNNRYGHPAADVLARHARAGAAVYRTDLDGAVTITTDGVEVVVETYRGPSARFTAPAGPVSLSSIPAPARRASGLEARGPAAARLCSTAWKRAVNLSLALRSVDSGSKSSLRQRLASANRRSPSSS